MHFFMPESEVYVPDGLAVEQALARTTHIAFAAHQDDIEFMAAGPILECYQRQDRWFSGVVVTDGRGSPRDGLYASYTDEEMRKVRFKEQKKAAYVGEYAAQVFLDYPSKVIKDGSNLKPVEDIARILRAARPRFAYTHNLADKHDTHVGVALKTLAAIRSLPPQERPEKLFGCEVWRDLDWMIDEDKVISDLSQHENLQAALSGVYDSQISGGKRYDLATMGRRKANATYYASHGVDVSTGLSYAMDLTPLIVDDQMDVNEFIQAHIQKFAQDVHDRLKRLTQR